MPEERAGHGMVTMRMVTVRVLSALLESRACAPRKRKRRAGKDAQTNAYYHPNRPPPARTATRGGQRECVRARGAGDVHLKRRTGRTAGGAGGLGLRAGTEK